MNKRIQELIDQCYEPAPLFRDGFESVIGIVFNKEKFAELLIQECVEVALDNLSCPAVAIICHFEGDE